MSSDLDKFVGLSSALTGIPVNRLAPQIDPVGLPPIFLDYVTPRITPEVLNALLAQYTAQAAQKLPPDLIAQKVLVGTGPQPVIPQTVLAARSIMKLWLLGVWYQPYDAGNFKVGESTVVSDQAYIYSWAWKIAQAHPMGYSESFFGYWNAEPSSLEDLTGVPANGQQGALS
ncbi:sorbitol dehydrogenase [Pseudomonas hefeiensis]|uniref:Sorbitol dehydrogenase n=1 Tax=Pseudomonas hefeiensis TaxID=2738125 RepID=A0ABY9GBE1_9PSED|nr:MULTISPECIES: sorbitol dehydrogenase [unclassified Pseudomonas]WLH12987.1 sorbitol dehydrogenase [Pseudomonas sp. FP205]WLH96052.1 sorbitol dehydrogenase [Pseudomonas sp. FP53]WLI40325.1 sorbitol dehydrogenase [Pseudomonas sp. FP821]